MDKCCNIDTLKTDVNNEIYSICNQLIEHYSPSKVILFGSQSKGTSNIKSDIDLCVIKDSTNKRSLLTDMYLNIESKKPFDLILYSNEEWKQCIEDSTSFAFLINQKGTILYGR